MSISGTAMMTLFAAALAVLISLWVLKTFGCPGAHRLGRCGLIAAARTRPRVGALVLVNCCLRLWGQCQRQAESPPRLRLPIREAVAVAD
jgi:hypothetical protein